MPPATGDEGQLDDTKWMKCIIAPTSIDVQYLIPLLLDQIEAWKMFNNNCILSKQYPVGQATGKSGGQPTTNSKNLPDPIIHEGAREKEVGHSEGKLLAHLAHLWAQRELCHYELRRWKPFPLALKTNPPPQIWKHAHDNGADRVAADSQRMEIFCNYACMNHKVLVFSIQHRSSIRPSPYAYKESLRSGNRKPTYIVTCLPQSKGYKCFGSNLFNVCLHHLDSAHLLRVTQIILSNLNC